MPGTWTDLAATSAELTFNLGAYLPGIDEIIAFGGGVTAPTGSFNGTAWSDPAPATTPPPLTEHGMAYDGVGALMFGGFELGSGIMDPPQTWRYSAANWHHLSPATSPGRRTDPCMCDIPGGVLLFGGSDGTGVPYLNDTWKWDQTTWTEIFPGTPPPPRIGGQMAYLPGSGVFLFGGTDDDTGLALGDTWFYDLDADEWADITLDLSGSPDPRFYGALAFDGTALALFGGRVWPGGTGPSVVTTNAVWTLDLGQLAWCLCSGLASEPSARDSIGMVYDSARERAVTWSGDTGPGTTADDTWSFEGQCCSVDPDPVVAAISHRFGLG